VYAGGCQRIGKREEGALQARLTTVEGLTSRTILALQGWARLGSGPVGGRGRSRPTRGAAVARRAGGQGVWSSSCCRCRRQEKLGLAVDSALEVVGGERAGGGIDEVRGKGGTKGSRAAATAEQG